MIRFVTAGESHGQALIAWISGLPAGVPIDFEFIQRELHTVVNWAMAAVAARRSRKIALRRWRAYGMDRRSGAPIVPCRIENRDWAKLGEELCPSRGPPREDRSISASA